MNRAERKAAKAERRLNERIFARGYDILDDSIPEPSPPSYLDGKERVYEHALEGVCKELGVPQPGYPAPVANAYAIASEALAMYREDPDLPEWVTE